MKRILIAILLLNGVGLAQGTPKKATQSDVSAGAPRYQLFSEPSLPGFVFLLDTTTGRIWKMSRIEELPGQPVVWEPQTRFDSWEQERDWFTKQASAAESLQKDITAMGEKLKQQRESQKQTDAK